MSKLEIAVIDYGLGNVRSIINAIKAIGAEATLTGDSQKILDAPACILPGVGAFGFGMQNLYEADLVPTIRRYAQSGKPLLGICLGMQLMLEESEEFGTTQGIGLVPGQVKILTHGNQENPVKLPHVCWNEVSPPNVDRWQSTPMANTGENENFYFVHSYAAFPARQSDILSTTNYSGIEFCSAINRDNVTGLQFHPEKSGPAGLNILRKFVDEC